MTGLQSLPEDVRRATRVLLRSRGFFVTAVLLVGLGIGANAAVFQLVDALLLRPLPVPNPEALTVLQLADATRWNGRRTSAFPALSNPLWEEVRANQTLFDGVLAWANADLRVGLGESRHTARGLLVSGEFFGVLGIHPALGRLFTAEDDRPGCDAIGAVVSDGFWRRELGGDPTAVGRAITVGDRQLNVLGVTPHGFAGLEIGRGFDIAVPICSQAVLGSERGWLTNGVVWWLTVMGRLRPGQTLAAVNAALPVVSRQWFDTTIPAGSTAQEASDYQSLRLRAVRGDTGVSALRGAFGDPLLMLLLIAALVLVLVCTSLALLVLSRASSRRPEFALRLAIGASIADVVRQVTVENVMLALAGAGLGLAVCGMLSRLLLGLIGTDVALELRLDGSLVGFVALAALLACTVFGIVPAWLASRAAATSVSLVTTARGTSALAHGSRIRQGLVVVQLALSLVLLCGAFLFGGTLRNLLAVDRGFRPDDVTVARVDFSRLGPAMRGAPIRREVLQRLQALPGVSAAAEVRHVPLSGTGTTASVQLEGRDRANSTAIRLNPVSDGYFAAMGITLTSGRAFTTADSTASVKVAIVNDAFVKRLGITGSPLGLRFQLNDETVEIVGLLANTKHFSLREEFLPIAFVPMAQIVDPRPYTDFVIRGAPVTAVADGTRRAIRDLNAGIDVDLRSLEAGIQRSLLRERLMALLSAFFGGLGVVIAVVGVYGVILELVSKRKAEIGLRIALGATRGRILELVFRRTGSLLLLGLVLGTLLVIVSAGSARSLVFGVQPFDVSVLGYACAVLGGATAAATVWPACRAAMLEPMAALRDSV